MSDEAQSLRNYGIENEMAVHVVNRAPPFIRPEISSSQQQNDETSVRNTDEQYHHAHINSHNVIFGTIPLERTPIFNNFEQTISILRLLLDDLRSSFDINSEVSLRNNQETEDGYTISLILRGPHLSTVDSPAREQFDQLCKDLKKLAWMVTTVKVLFFSIFFLLYSLIIFSKVLDSF